MSFYGDGLLTTLRSHTALTKPDVQQRELTAEPDYFNMPYTFLFVLRSALRKFMPRVNTPYAF